jgi:hypothetical protein
MGISVLAWLSSLDQYGGLGMITRPIWKSELTDIDGKACNNIPEAVNKLALSDRLDHSCETG